MGQLLVPTVLDKRQERRREHCNGKVIVSKVFSAEPKVPSNPVLAGEQHGTTSAAAAQNVCAFHSI
jgi:hypothetical protein